jgi:hypothetical protein
MTEHERAILTAAREWSRVHRLVWPSGSVSDPDEPRLPHYKLKLAEQALIAAVEGRQ